MVGGPHEQGRRSTAATSSRSIRRPPDLRQRPGADGLRHASAPSTTAARRDDFTDDKPRGTPLPCTVRESASVAFPTTRWSPTASTAPARARTTSSCRSGWPRRPSLEGVKLLGSAFHMGRSRDRRVGRPRSSRGHRLRPRGRARALGQPADRDRRARRRRDPAGRLVLARPPTTRHRQRRRPLLQARTRCSRRRRRRPTRRSPSYARTPEGGKAIYRAPVRTGGQATVCTAHVFQQIPGQNRIFMGWYSQGTQVVDFTENPDGTVTLKEAGYSSRPTRTSGSRRSSRPRRTRTGRSPTGAPRPTSTSASAAATRSTSTA